MLALPAVLVLLNVVDPIPVLVMVAVPAVLELEKVVTALMPLLAITALPAVLLLLNANIDMDVSEKLGAFEELLMMPAPTTSNLTPLLIANE